MVFKIFVGEIFADKQEAYLAIFRMRCDDLVLGSFFCKAVDPLHSAACGTVRFLSTLLLS